MRFYKLPDSIGKEINNNSKLKIEYFWHYWDFLFTENRSLILVNEPKFTSQVSLIIKIEKHLEWNNGFNIKKLNKYFNQHIYFNQKNLILRTNKELQDKIKQLKSDITANIEGDFRRLYFLNKFRELRKEFFQLEDFSSVLVSKLSRIIFHNSDLKNQSKEDLKFLCNSIIDILVLRGYPMTYIKGVLSNIVFNFGNKYKFNYDKKYKDFNTVEEWNQYVSDEYKLLSLKDRLEYLRYSLIKPKSKGYYIFEVKGVNFESKPIEIFGTKYYNPKRDKFLKYFDTKKCNNIETNYSYFTKQELFYTENEIFNELETKESNCNLIVPIYYFTEDMGYFSHYEMPAKSFIEAFGRAEVSILEFKKYFKSFSVDHFSDDSLSLIKISERCILTDINFNYHTASNEKLTDQITFKTDDIRLKMVNERLKYKNKIKSQNTFFEHLANSNALISSYQIEKHKFSFKSLWIECFEPYFKDIDEIIFYLKKSIRLRTNLFSGYRIILSNSLRFSMGIGNQSYSLEKEFMNKLGIGDLGIGEIIDGSKLKACFESLPNDSLLEEMKAEMREFVSDELVFFKKIDNWISEIVRVAYDERNIEVHYNLINYYNDVSIKKDILFLASCIIGAFNDAIYKNDIENIDEAKEYINNNFNKLS